LASERISFDGISSYALVHFNNIFIFIFAIFVGVATTTKFCYEEGVLEIVIFWILKAQVMERVFIIIIWHIECSRSHSN